MAAGRTLSGSGPGSAIPTGSRLQAGDSGVGIERLFGVSFAGRFPVPRPRWRRRLPPTPARLQPHQRRRHEQRDGLRSRSISARPTPSSCLRSPSTPSPPQSPPGTPDHETGSRSVPGTGPYEIVSITDMIASRDNGFVPPGEHDPHRPCPAGPRLPRPHHDHPVLLHHRSDVGPLPNLRRRKLDPAVPRPAPPISPRSSAAAARPATATTATRRSTTRCNAHNCSNPLQPTKSSALWEALDRRLTNAAVWVPTVASREVELDIGPSAQLQSTNPRSRPKASR